MIEQFIPAIVRDFFAPAFSLLGATALFGGGLALAAASLLPIPWLAPLARKLGVVLLALYAAFAIGMFSGRREIRAEWQAANDMIEIVYAERDAENFNKTRALADQLEQTREIERKQREKDKDAVRRKIGPGNSRFTKPDIERLREFMGNAPARR